MLLKLSVSITTLFLSFCCNGQVDGEKSTSVSGKKLYVVFFIGAKEINIHNRFKILFLNEKDTINVEVKGNQLVLPSLEKDTGYKIVFIYKKFLLSFNGFTRKMIIPDQDITWKFGVDNRPFNESLDILSPAGYKALSLKIKQLQYFQFLLMEYGDGIQFVKKIE